MTTAVAMKLNLTARDITGQKEVAVRDLPIDTTVQDLVQGLVMSMNLPERDSTGTQQAFHAYLDRDGRHLHASETVGEVLREADEIVIHPDVQAGAVGAVQ